MRSSWKSHFANNGNEDLSTNDGDAGGGVSCYLEVNPGLLWIDPRWLPGQRSASAGMVRSRWGAGVLCRRRGSSGRRGLSGRCDLACFIWEAWLAWEV